jgi:hypothetical protein
MLLVQMDEKDRKEGVERKKKEWGGSGEERDLRGYYFD